MVTAKLRADSSAVSGACAPPMAVRTQPGVTATTVMPRARHSAAMARVSMLRAALETL